MAAVIALGLALGGAVGCGKKGDPRPPLKIIPATADDLVLEQMGETLVLRVGYPKTTTAGEPLPGLESVEVWQLERPVTDPENPPSVSPDEFAAGAARHLALRGAELTSAIAGDTIVTRFPIEIDPEEPILLVFGVATTAEDGETSAFSNLQQIVPRPPPARPTGLEVVPGPDGITVTWEYPDDPEGESGGGSKGFHVYRRIATERSYGEPLDRVGPRGRRFVDETAQYGNRYIYAVTAIGSLRPLVESSRSIEREIEFEDRFAPPPPRDLVVLPQESSVRLVWQASGAPDVAGYHVYRVADGGEERRLTDEPLPDLRFVDTGLATGVTFEYRITAVDRIGNEGEPTPPAVITLR